MMLMMMMMKVMKSTVVLLPQFVQVQALVLPVDETEALEGARVHAGRVEGKLERLLCGVKGSVPERGT